jgi:hypothetical protein
MEETHNWQKQYLLFSYFSIINKDNKKKKMAMVGFQKVQSLYKTMYNDALTFKFSSSTYAYVHQVLHLLTYLPLQIFICFIHMLSRNYISKWFLTIKRPKSFKKSFFLHTILFERIFCSKFEVFMLDKLGLLFDGCI